MVTAVISFLAFISAGVLIALDSGGSEAEGDGAVFATATATPGPRTRAASPTLKPRPTVSHSGTPTKPATTPNPADIVPGGDQPTGPIPDQQGNIAENQDLSPEMVQLRDDLSFDIYNYSQANDGMDVSLAVTDLQTGEVVSINGNKVHKTGCVINIFALLAAVKEFEAGNASPSGLEYSIQKGIGGSYPPEVKNFLEAIYGSYVTGSARAQEYMREWGLVIGNYDHVPYYGGDNPGPNLLTALESNSILTKLYKQELFDAYWTQYTLGVLRNSYSYVDYILPKYLPYNATVAHKIGYHWDYDGWVNNDVGIVTFTGADGYEKAYSISYFSQYAPSEEAGYTFGATLSAQVWNFMVSRYGTPAPYIPPPPTPAPTNPPTQPPTNPPTQPPTAPPTPAPTPRPTPTPPPTPTPIPTRTPSGN